MIFYEEKIKTLEKNYNNFPFKKDRNRQFLAILWAIVNTHFNNKVGFTLAKGDAYFLHDCALVKMQEGGKTAIFLGSIWGQIYVVSFMNGL